MMLPRIEHTASADGSAAFRVRWRTADGRMAMRRYTREDVVDPYAAALLLRATLIRDRQNGSSVNRHAG